MSEPDAPPPQRVDALPAFDRVQQRPETSPIRRERPPKVRWVLLTVVLLVGVGLGTWWLWPSSQGAGEFLPQLARTADG